MFGMLHHVLADILGHQVSWHGDQGEVKLFAGSVSFDCTGHLLTGSFELADRFCILFVKANTVDGIEFITDLKSGLVSWTSLNNL